MGRANLLHDIYFQTCKKTYSPQQYDSVLVVAKCSRDLLLKKGCFIFFQVHYLFFCTQGWTRQAAYDPHFWNLSMLESDFFPDIFVKDPKKRDCRCHCHSNALNLTSFHIPMWPDIYADVSPIPKLCSRGGRRQKNIGGASTKYKIGTRWRFTA